uniref:Anaphase-promoting complex subunit 4 WD40 domain-containing protein n=2 Tax=Rhizochromulina marina TaxID=1034831 RepID=A0A7S2RC09_9STRA|mmetsp:Transcript_14090/g.41424  ORF Transcript_14090/g.41424 Transcript_14090/m.41424 type:complete len:439 (+) Transcript_14090:292-1608(+)
MPSEGPIGTELQVLASLVLVDAEKDPQTLYAAAEWEGHANGGESRTQLMSRLESLIAVEDFVPHGRLATLLGQALEHQLSEVPLFNPPSKGEANVTLLEDVACGRSMVPVAQLALIHEHSDEILGVGFSPDGNRLATVSRDSTAKIFAVDSRQHPIAIELRHTLAHDSPPHRMDWGNSGTVLLTLSENSKFWIWDAGTGHLLRSGLAHYREVTCLRWLDPAATMFATGSLERTIRVWYTTPHGVDDHAEVQAGGRVNDMAVTADWRNVVAVRSDHVIMVFAINAQFVRDPGSTDASQALAEVSQTVCEGDTVVSLEVSLLEPDLALLFCSSGLLHLWSLSAQRSLKVLAGHNFQRYVLRPTFGGYQERFVACGGEDGRIHLWHREQRNPIALLPGHTGPVNCVAWCSTDNQIFASASDDKTVRIWGPPSREVLPDLEL